MLEAAKNLKLRWIFAFDRCEFVNLMGKGWYSVTTDATFVFFSHCFVCFSFLRFFFKNFVMYIDSEKPRGDEPIKYVSM